MKKIAIIQPVVNNYRSEFFNYIEKKTELSVFTYKNFDNEKSKGFNIDLNFPTIKLRTIEIGRFLYYDIFPLINNNFDYIVILGNVNHLSAWLLLVLGKILNIKIIIWGHGLSIKRYIKESKNLPTIRLLMYRLSYGSWFYTEKELDFYRKKIKKLNSVSLNNTISDIEKITCLKPLDRSQIKKLKIKHNISTKYNLIICTRFESPFRKSNELIDVINGINKDWGFIIIGDGKFKPNFNKYEKVYDFGKVYDRSIKNELFQIANLYIQLGHVGLSVVEAFAYRLPIITLKRSINTHHSVEYNYIENGVNGIICKNLNEVIFNINTNDNNKYKIMGLNAYNFVSKNLNIKNMAKSGLSLITK